MATVPKQHVDEPADVLAIFGISGDLAKKMTFRSLYLLEAGGKLDCPIVGVAIDEWDDERLRRHAHESIEATVDDPDYFVKPWVEDPVTRTLTQKTKPMNAAAKMPIQFSPPLPVWM